MKLCADQPHRIYQSGENVVAEHAVSTENRTQPCRRLVSTTRMNFVAGEGWSAASSGAVDSGTESLHTPVATLDAASAAVAAAVANARARNPCATSTDGSEVVAESVAITGGAAFARGPVQKLDLDIEPEEESLSERKSRNLAVKWPSIPSNTIRTGDGAPNDGLPDGLRWMQGSNLGPTAKSVGIPYMKAIAGYRKYRGQYTPVHSGIVVFERCIPDFDHAMQRRTHKRESTDPSSGVASTACNCMAAFIAGRTANAATREELCRMFLLLEGVPQDPARNIPAIQRYIDGHLDSAWVLSSRSAAQLREVAKSACIVVKRSMSKARLLLDIAAAQPEVAHFHAAITRNEAVINELLDVLLRDSGVLLGEMTRSSAVKLWDGGSAAVPVKAPVAKDLTGIDPSLPMGLHDAVEKYFTEYAAVKAKICADEGRKRARHDAVIERLGCPMDQAPPALRGQLHAYIAFADADPVEEIADFRTLAAALTKSPAPHLPSISTQSLPKLQNLHPLLNFSLPRRTLIDILSESIVVHIAEFLPMQESMIFARSIPSARVPVYRRLLKNRCGVRELIRPKPSLATSPVSPATRVTSAPTAYILARTSVGTLQERHDARNTRVVQIKTQESRQTYKRARAENEVEARCENCPSRGRSGNVVLPGCLYRLCGPCCRLLPDRDCLQHPKRM
jgi:Rad4 beta-hairpin domain 3